MLRLSELAVQGLRNKKTPTRGLRWSRTWLGEVSKNSLIVCLNVRSGQPNRPIESLAPGWLQVEDGIGALIYKGADSVPRLKARAAL